MRFCRWLPSWRWAALALAVGVAVGWGIWLNGPSPRLTLPGDGAVLWPVRFSEGGQWLVTEKRTAKFDLLEHQVWRLEPPRVVLRFPTTRVYARAFSPDGQWFAQAHAPGDSAQATRVEIWNLQTGQEDVARRWTDLPGNLRWNMSGSILAFDREDRLLLAATNFGVWDVDAKTKVGPLESLTLSGPIPCNWETSLLGYVRERRLQLYSLSRQEVAGEFTFPADLRNYRWSEDGHVLAADFYLYAGSGHLTGIHVLDARTGSHLRVAAASGAGPQSVSTDGQWLAASTETAWVNWWARLWKKEGIAQPVIWVFHVPDAALHFEIAGRSALFAPSNNMLAVRTQAGDVQVWDIPPGPPWLRSLAGGLAATMSLITVVSLGRRLRRNKSPHYPSNSSR